MTSVSSNSILLKVTIPPHLDESDECAPEIAATLQASLRRHYADIYDNHTASAVSVAVLEHDGAVQADDLTLWRTGFGPFEHPSRSRHTF